jgi:hypothetical protein
MAQIQDAWDAVALRERCRQEIERGEAAFRKMFGTDLPTNPNRQAFHDLCLAELDVRRFLLKSDAFSSREALLTSMRRLIGEPVPASSPVCSTELYFKCQKQEVEMEMSKL